MRRRLIVLVALLGAAIAAALYLRCGKGWGTGGKGPGKGGGTGSVGLQKPARCAVRLTATGITVDGKQVTRDEAVEVCKRTTGADVLVTGDARQGDWDDLRGAFERANIHVFAREPRGVAPNDAAPPD
jgi:hypothetical protein